MAIPRFRYSFATGFSKMTLEDARHAKKELYDFLGCKAESEFSRKKHSFLNIPQHVYEGVTAIFAKYGVPESEVWSKTMAP